MKWQVPHNFGMRFLIAISLSLFASIASAQVAFDEQEHQFMVKVLSKIQMTSIEREVEMCGYVGRDDDGRLVITEILDGTEATCTLPDWPKWDVYASFHTHSSYSPNYDSEVPSTLDLESDEASGINGWISTPGGRLWYHDSDVMTAYMVCDAGCLPQDPRFVDEPRGSIKPSYSYRALIKREGN
jgi:hypothetical protein